MKESLRELVYSRRIEFMFHFRDFPIFFYLVGRYNARTQEIHRREFLSFIIIRMRDLMEITNDVLRFLSFGVSCNAKNIRTL